MKVVKNRINRPMDENEPQEQAAYKKKYSTIHHLHTVQQILKKTNEYFILLHVAFID